MKDLNNNVHWFKLDMFALKSCEDFFELSVVEVSTSNTTAKKHKHATQKYLDVVERKETQLKDNLRIKLALKTQLERKKLLTTSKKRTIDAHAKIPLKCLSMNNENKSRNV